MNAHINRDLPVALVSTCEERGVELRGGSPEHSDFERVNGLLAQVEARVKASYLTGALAFLDRIVHRFDRIDDVVAMWDIRRARDAAWTNGEALWALRAQPELRSTSSPRSTGWSASPGAACSCLRTRSCAGSRASSGLDAARSVT